MAARTSVWALRTGRRFGGPTSLAGRLYNPEMCDRVAFDTRWDLSFCNISYSSKTLSKKAYRRPSTSQTRFQLVQPGSNHHPQYTIPNMLQFLIIQTRIFLRIFKPPFPPRKTTLMSKHLFLEDWITDDREGR